MRNPVFERTFTDSGVPVRITWMRHSAFFRSTINCHREIEFQYIKHGHGSYLIAGDFYPFRANSLLLIPSLAVHTLIPHPDTLLEKAAMIFSPTALLDRTLRQLLDRTPRQLLLSERDATRVNLILHQIDEEKSRIRPFDLEMIRLKLRELIYLIQRVPAQENAGIGDQPLVMQLMAYLEQNYNKPFCIKEVAKRFGFSESHLSHLFRLHAGMGLKQYLLHHRILEAKRLLDIDPRLKVQSVAEKVGFMNFCVFNRHFQKMTGFKPSAYRRIIHTNCRN